MKINMAVAGAIIVLATALNYPKSKLPRVGLSSDLVPISKNSKFHMIFKASKSFHQQYELYLIPNKNSCALVIPIDEGLIQPWDRSKHVDSEGTGIISLNGFVKVYGFNTNTNNFELILYSKGSFLGTSEVDYSCPDIYVQEEGESLRFRFDGFLFRYQLD